MGPWQPAFGVRKSDIPSEEQYRGPYHVEQGNLIASFPILVIPANGTILNPESGSAVQKLRYGQSIIGRKCSALCDEESPR